MTSSDQPLSNSATNDILGIVLAGGQSSRMKTNKATLCIDGVSNLERASQALNNCDVSNVVISGSHIQEKHIKDRYPNGGPLAGIFSVLLTTKESKDKPSALLIIPVDMPLLTPRLLNTLIQQGIKNNTACCYKSHNLPIYLPVTDKLIEFLTNEFLSERFTKYNKGPSFKHLLKHISCEFITTPDVGMLANANTPEQWDKISQLINIRQ